MLQQIFFFRLNPMANVLAIVIQLSGVVILIIKTTAAKAKQPINNM